MVMTPRTALATGSGRHTLGSPGYRRTTVALFAAGMTTFMALYYVQALLPELSAHYGISPTTSALAVSLTTGFLALAIIPASVLSERFGRVRIMVISAVAASAIGVVLPWSPTAEILLAGRAVQGVLCAGVPAVAMAYLAEEIDRRALGTAMGRYVAGTTIGGLTGRLIPGFAVDIVSWQWALEIACLVSLGFALVFWWTVPASRFFAPQPVSPSIAVLNLLVHLRDPRLRPLFLLGFVLMGGFCAPKNPPVNSSIPGNTTQRWSGTVFGGERVGLRRRHRTPCGSVVALPVPLLSGQLRRGRAWGSCIFAVWLGWGGGVRRGAGRSWVGGGCETTELSPLTSQ